MKNEQHKNLVITIAILLLAVMCNNTADAQAVSYENAAMMRIANESSKPGWVNFKAEANLNPLTLFIDNKEAFGLGNDDEMRLTKTASDELGFTHYRYQQYYKGVKVYGAQYIVHSNAQGMVISANGKLVTSLNKTVDAPVTESAALKIAMDATCAKSFKWQDAESEKFIRQRKNSADASYFPKGELIWCKPAGIDAETASAYRLCRKFDINTDTTALSMTMFVDVTTGKVIKQLPLELTCNGSFTNTVFNSMQSVKTNYDSGLSKYILEDDCSGNANIHVYNAANSQTLNYAKEITSTNNKWLYNANFTQILWGLEWSYKYFKNRRNRDGFDGSNSAIAGYGRALFPMSSGGLTASNASFSNTDEVFRFGFGSNAQDNKDDFTTLDIIAHEFTHGVTLHSAALDYEKESGALNESFSDIFGEAAEYYTAGNDWLMGAQRDSGGRRSLADPWLYKQPKYYYDSLFASTSGVPSLANDYCGVHTNSGVQNYVFYLLSVGGTGTNWNGKNYDVGALGPDAAGAIAYRALTVYLTNNSNFADSREAWIHSAKDFYGACSYEAIQTGMAWFAAGVGQSNTYYNHNVCGTYPILNINNEFTGINAVNGGGSGCITTVQAAIYSVTFSGNYEVNLRPGFTAQAGSHFVARLLDCGVTNYKASAPVTNAAQLEMDNTAKDKMGSTTVFSAKAFPVPFSDKLNVEFSLKTESEISLKLTDVLGRTILNPLTQQGYASGLHQLEIATNNLPKGIYLLIIENQGNREVIKVNKL